MSTHTHARIMSHELCELGVIGLTTIGQSLAAHHASSGTRVAVADHDDANFVKQVVSEYKQQMGLSAGEGEGDGSVNKKTPSCMHPCADGVEEISKSLRKPRRMIVFGTHGDEQKFAEIWEEIAPTLEGGDMVLRWGKEDDSDDADGRVGSVQLYRDSIVSNIHTTQGKPQGIHLAEMVRTERDRAVVFKGDTPDAFLFGGSRVAYEHLEPFISPFASSAHAGEDAGCAHYAHMVQRTIENGLSQAFVEGSEVLSKASRHEEQDIGRILNNWNAGGTGRLSSYLLRISSKIFYKRDHITKTGFVINHIVDTVDMTPADTWMTLEATKLGIPAPTINAVLESRFASVRKGDRVMASSVLNAPEGADTPSVMKDQIGTDLERAIYCACVCLIGECLAIFQAASNSESWDANIADILEFWNRPGTFLESNILGKVHSALVKLDGDEELRNLMTLPDIASELQELHMSWRRIVTLSFASAIPCAALSSSLTSYDTSRSRMLPAGIIRAQRDFFSASGYSRFEQEGWFSTNWIPEHTREMKKKGE